MSHFTYRSQEPDADLEQGDVLSRTEDLDRIISEFHPYYKSAKFSGFLVTTQSCDLVRRDGKTCKAPYIALSAIKPFEKVMEREIRKYQSELLRLAEAISTKHKDLLLKFIEKLFNNNHPEYFYMHEDASIGPIERSCAYLRLCISVKSQHYDCCLKARKASLSTGFQSKLGWHIGNLYSRVGTDDWVPKIKNASEWTTMLNAVLNESINIMDEKSVSAASRLYNISDLVLLKSEEVRQKINDIQIPKRKDGVIDAVISQLRKDKMLDENQLNTLKKRLESNSALAALVK